MLFFFFPKLSHTVRFLSGINCAIFYYPLFRYYQRQLREPNIPNKTLYTLAGIARDLGTK